MQFRQSQCEESDFALWAAAILSEQMPQDRVYQFLKANPKFANWYRAKYCVGSPLQRFGKGVPLSS